MLKTKTRVKGSLAVSLLAVSTFLPQFLWQDTSAEEVNTTFQVNVQESLSVSITVPQTWASGSIDTLLRNEITISASTNNSSGFTANMYSDTSASNDTDLVNAISSSNTLPTLAANSSWTRSDTGITNFWGYSFNDGNASGTYYPMKSSSTPITILNNTSSQTIHFGAKANASKASGAYLGTVVFNVVTGTPTNPPATPTDDNPASVQGETSPATYDNVNDRTVYTTVSSSGSGSTATTTTTTQVSSGDTTGLYAPAQGETRRTESNIADTPQVATGLAVAASAAAAGGMVFFILAKRREEEEEDEEDLQQ